MYRGCSAGPCYAHQLCSASNSPNATLCSLALAFSMSCISRRRRHALWESVVCHMADTDCMRMQEWNEIQFNGVYYAPPKQGAPGAEPDFDTSYTFNYPRPKRPENLRIYECHVGMSSEEPKVGSTLPSEAVKAYVHLLTSMDSGSLLLTLGFLGDADNV